MCVVSFIGDTYRDRDNWPWQRIEPMLPAQLPVDFESIAKNILRDGEIGTLKQRVKALEDLVKAGRKFDEQTGQPDCETDAKWKELRKLAEELGVKLDI